MKKTLLPSQFIFHSQPIIILEVNTNTK